jgi:hypothetical protein
MAWDRTKPTASSLLVSNDLRQNWSALQRSIAGVNLLGDPIFEIWPYGDAIAPAHWRTTGAGATIARTGTGLGDTQRKVGKYAAKLTAGAGAVAQLVQSLLTTASYDSGFNGLTFAAGAWVRATAAFAARIGIADGFGTTYSNFHTGSGTFEWLEVTRVVAGGANKAEFVMECSASQAAHLSGPTVIFGEVPPLYFQPGMIALTTETAFIAGTQTVANRKLGADRYFKRPAIIRSVQLAVQTGPVPSTALTVRPCHFDGAVHQPMFTTNPSITTSGLGSPFAPDGTYRYRCFTGLTSSAPADALLSIDVTTVGAPNPGLDLYVLIHYASYERPLEAFLAHNEFN